MTQAACRLSDLPSRMAVKSSGPGRCWLWTSDGKGGGAARLRPTSPLLRGKAELARRVVFGLFVGESRKVFRCVMPILGDGTTCFAANQTVWKPCRGWEAVRRRDWEGARAGRTHCPHGQACTSKYPYVDP